jgi:hypothetical protein
MHELRQPTTHRFDLILHASITHVDEHHFEVAMCLRREALQGIHQCRSSGRSHDHRKGWSDHSGRIFMETQRRVNAFPTGARPFLHPSVRVAVNAAGCLANAHVVLVANADPAFAELDPELWGVEGKRPIVFDCWRILPVDRLSAIAEIRYLGIGIAGSRINSPATEDPSGGIIQSVPIPWTR